MEMLYLHCFSTSL